MTVSTWPEFADPNGVAITDGCTVTCDDFDDEEALVVSRCSEDADMRGDGEYVALPASITVMFADGSDETISRNPHRWMDDETTFPVVVIG